MFLVAPPHANVCTGHNFVTNTPIKFIFTIALVVLSSDVYLSSDTYLFGHITAVFLNIWEGFFH